MQLSFAACQCHDEITESSSSHALEQVGTSRLDVSNDQHDDHPTTDFCHEELKMAKSEASNPELPNMFRVALGPVVTVIHVIELPQPVLIPPLNLSLRMRAAAPPLRIYHCSFQI